jgi:threonine aldolase
MSDFRSDTVTRPTEAMRSAMHGAPVGDDVFGDDPTVNQLQAEAAALLGFEAGLFAPSGTQSNLIALMSHCGRGDEVIVGQLAHTYRWEAGGMAVLGSIQPQPIENEPDGTMPIAKIRAAIKPDDPHFARTAVLALENTIGGQVLPRAYLAQAKAVAREAGLRLHLDGARLFNAAVFDASASAHFDSAPIVGGDSESGTASPERGAVIAAAREICAGFDSVSLCLSKGLGCPVGSLLLGSAELVDRAHRIRKILGGAMRQAGILAAAGVHALAHHLVRLDNDHRLARRLAAGIDQCVAGHPGLSGRVRVQSPQTNMVFIEIDSEIGPALARHFDAAGIRLTSGLYGGGFRQRWVTHLDVGGADVDQALAAWRDFRPER